MYYEFETTRLQIKLENNSQLNSQEILYNFNTNSANSNENLKIAEILVPLVPKFRNMLVPKGISIF